MTDRNAKRLHRLNQLAAALGILAFAMLVWRYGFPEIQLPRWVQFAWSAALPIGFFLEAMYRLLWVEDPWRYLTLHPLRYVILFMIVLELSGVAAWSEGGMLDRRSASLLAGELYLAVFLLGFAGSWAKGAILANRWLANQRIPVLALPAITFAFAIIAGGAGFPVAANLARYGVSRAIPWMENRPLTQASRVVLITSGGLIALGAALFMIDGWLHETSRTLLEAIFQSVTTRTAGFQIESQLHFNTLGLVSTILLMIVGASPQSTGGGIKTTVLARLFKRIDPRDPASSSKWLIAFKPFRPAWLLATLYLLTGLFAAMLMLYTDHLSIQDATFEAFSALGTVGLSRDVTPALSAAGK